MRTIHHIIIATLFLTNLFGVIPNKKMRQEDDLGNTSNQFANSRVVTSSSYFNGNEWYARVVNDGQWATDEPASAPGGLWPRGTNNSVLYDAGLWIGFKDDQDDVHFSGVKWSSDFTPGPYGVTDSDNENYRVYKLNRWDGVSDTDWSEWPVDLGAPWIDSDLNGTYDPSTDQPYMPLDQTLYSVFHDSTNHTVFGTSINGVEVHQTIFGGVSSAHSDLSRTFFIKYEIINKGSINWNNARFGVWSDVDLGHPNNDAISVDVDSNMVYCYSAEAGADADVFGSSPAVGFRYISGLNSLDDNLSSGGCIGSGCTDGAWNYEYYDPQDQWQAYNRMLGLQNNGNSIVDPDGENSFFTTTGDPVTGTGWLDYHIEEKQMFLSAAVDEDNAVVEPGDTVEFVMAVIIAQGTDNLNSITELRDASYEAKTLWDSNFNGVSLVDRPLLESDEDYGLFSNISLDNAGPGGTTELSRTYHNTGNEALNISMSANNVIVSPSSATIATGGSQSFSFSYTADNFTYSAHNVPSEYGTIQSAVDAATATSFSENMDLTIDDPYTTNVLITEYGHTGSGDTILVAPGTYTENVTIDKSINLIATDGDPSSTIINGNNDAPGIVILVYNAGSFSLNGFTIQNGGDGEYRIGAGILLEHYGTVNIINNIIKDNNAGSGYGGGLYSWYATGTVSRNTFINNTATYGSAARINAGGLNFYNNTLWNNQLVDARVLYARSSDHRIINNIIWDNNSNNGNYIVVNESPTVEYNIVKNGYDGTGNISDDPQFYDPANGDFRLTASSPAIDAGDPDLDDDGEDYSTDEDDQDPDGSRMDIGAILTNIILSTSTEHTIHGDTALVDVQIGGELPLSMSSIDISFSGFQDKLIFHDIVTDGYMFGNLDWVTQVNDTEALLITASAGANAITETGILFAIELIVPDTLSTQFVPIVISDFLVNTDITNGTFLDGGIEVVWEPTANFISDTTTGYLPLVISFTDTSEIGTYPINQWLWDFGDDSTATGADVEHTYTHEGQYTVTLTVTDEFGLSDTLVMDDYIDALHPIYPVAGFSASVTSGGYPLSVTFTDTSNMGTYEINNWLWDFGNDSTGSGSSVSMSYQRPGEFDVILTITDEYGLSDTLISSSFIDVDTTFGDVDWNTNVQSFDASLILQDLVEIIELDSLQTLIGDVSGDTSLSTLDATLILQYVVGLIDELPYIPDNQYLATGDLTMSDQGADPGMLVEIPINISNGSNIYGFTGTIYYDHTILNYDTLLLSDYLEGYLVAFNELSPGEIKIAASGNNPDGETGVFSTLVFYVTNAFTEETSISITNLIWNEGEIIELAAEMSITYGLGIDGIAIPDVYALHQNYPNPFNPTTQIKYDLPEDAMVNITIFDVMGRSIKSLVNMTQSAGYRSIQWDATNNLGEPVSAGMYIYMIQAGGFRQTKKMVLLK